MKYQEEICVYLEAHREDMIRDLGEVIALPSVLSAAAPHAPFGPDSAACLKGCLALFAREGFETRLFADSGYGLAFFGPESGTSIGLFAHSDVVPVIPEEWLYTQPFSMKAEGDRLFGRGVNDNKNAVIGTLYLLKAIRELKLPLKSRITVFIGSNEEAGMGDVKAFAREQPMPTVCLVPDSGFPASLGERGILRLDWKSDAAFTAVTALKGGAAYNTVMGQLDAALKADAALRAWVLENRPEWCAVEEAADRLVLHITGKAAHAGSPFLGESALLRLSRWLTGCPALPPEDGAIFAGMARLLADTDGTCLGIPHDDPVFGKLTCANGMVWLEEGRPVFTLDIRFGSSLEKDAVMAALDAIGQKNGFTVTTHYYGPGFLIPEAHPLARTILRTFNDFTGQEGHFFTMAGGTYSKYLKNSFSLGSALGDVLEGGGLPDGHGRAHQADETMTMPCWLRGTALLTLTTLALDEAIQREA